MIKKSFVTTLNGQFDGNCTEYINGIRIKLTNWIDGYIIVSVSRTVEPTELICNIPGMQIEQSRNSSMGHYIQFTPPVNPDTNESIPCSGDIIFKNAKYLFIANISTWTAGYPSRGMELYTYPYGSIDYKTSHDNIPYELSGVGDWAMMPENFDGTLHVKGEAMHGDVADFAKFFKLEGLILAETHTLPYSSDTESTCSNITGSLDVLAASMIEYGRDVSATVSTTDSNIENIINQYESHEGNYTQPSFMLVVKCNGKVTYKVNDQHVVIPNESTAYIFFANGEYFIRVK